MRVGAVEEMGAGSDFADGIECLCLLRQIEALGEGGDLAAQVGVHDGLLIAVDEAAFEPATCVVYEVGAGKHRHHQAPGAFFHRLAVR